MSSQLNAPTDFKALQMQFAGHIRDPETPIIAGIEDRRMKIYRELFFNNVEGFAATAFPVAKSIMGEAWWQQAVRDFLIEYRCESPYFHQISAEFLTFISELREPTTDQPGFLKELMHYEWVELALDVAEADPFNESNAYSNDLLDQHPVQSPVAWSLSYRYPVHQIGTEFQPTEAPEQPTWMMVYRDRHDQVQFMALNALTARLLYLLDQNESLTGRDALTQISQEMGHDDPTLIVDAGYQILQQFYEAGILLGAR